ncbi:MAG: asparaginase [Rhodospirillaceae bacterium]|nr:asparaginase [Rhodospirillaceae bacterium]
MRSFKAILAAALLFAGGAQAAADKPLVWVFSTGGTIAGSGSSPTDMSNYTAGQFTGEQLVRGLPQLADVAEIKVEQVVNILSNDLTVADWLTLSRRINETLADPRVAGVVVTHGTNTLEETAYFLNLTVKSDRPVVVVGAMRPATAISADGPLNLLNAVRVARSPDAKGKGALIVMNDEINAARDTTKTTTYRVETFRAPELGMLGYVDEDKVAFYRTPVKRHTVNSEFDVRALKTLPTVGVLYSYVEPRPELFQALVKAGDKGIVFAGTGAGALSKLERDGIDEMLKGKGAKPVMVLASRTGNGRVIGTKEYSDRGLIPADSLNAQKARILLMLALTKTQDPKEIRRIFAEY